MQVMETLRRSRLATVCQEARCPNLGECFADGTATFMILGRVCTRNCAFCAVEKGAPAPVDPGEPARLAEAAAALRLRHVVITSVTRDDLPDGGAAQFRCCAEAVKAALPDCSIELLVPDFAGKPDALNEVLRAPVDILNHNIETVPRLYPAVRPMADFERSIALLAQARRPGLKTKSGLMLGLGETAPEIEAALVRLRQAGCAIVTLGQYLQPTRGCLPVDRYVTPEEFESWAHAARALGFEQAVAGPLVRSSYHAADFR
jgi:lipoic acid synthetase